MARGRGWDESARARRGARGTETGRAAPGRPLTVAALAAALAAGILGAVLPGPAAAEVATGSGAVLRGLDKRDGTVRDMELPAGGEARFGKLSIALRECRYPEGNPAGDAFAFLTIREAGREAGREAPVFRGWMIASAPALNALDHQRYDVWVLRCTTR